MAIDKRKIPEINAGSMADIAFLLLIFFLVATTMNTDTGIQRVLPPWVDNPTDDAPPIKERNLMQVKVNQYDQIQVQGKLVHLSQVKDLAKDFILNLGNSEDLPEKVMTDIELFGASFSELDEAKRKAIQQAVQTKISEAEPKNIGGN